MHNIMPNITLGHQTTSTQRPVDLTAAAAWRTPSAVRPKLPAALVLTLLLALGVALAPASVSATGELTFVEAVSNSDISPAVGLDGASDVTVSPDGKHVYVVSEDDEAVVVFSRNKTTGRWCR